MCYRLGKSGYLPDISSAFAFWRSYAVNCLEQKNYNGATSGLYNINSLLTEEYIISIDTEAFHKQTKQNVFFECVFCKNEIPLTKTRICDIFLEFDDAMISGQKTAKKWFCPDCRKWVLHSRTTIIRDKLESPYYRRIVSECPQMHPMGGSRLGFPQKFDKWFYNFLEELQHALALYRIEYIAQNGEDMEEPGFKEIRNS